VGFEEPSLAPSFYTLVKSGVEEGYQILYRKPSVKFVSLSTVKFNSEVRDVAELYFNIVDTVPPTGMPGGLLLRGPGVIPHDAVVVAFSPAH
jgi:hypothetical protein